MPVLLLRHTESLPRDRWARDDEERGLSAEGHRQALLLVPALTEAKPERVLSSPFVRCVDTVGPLAGALGLPVEPVPELAEGAGQKAVELVRSFMGASVILCSHGDVIPEVLGTLSAEDGLDLGPRPQVAKGSVWVLGSDGTRFDSAKYLPPPAA